MNAILNLVKTIGVLLVVVAIFYSFWIVVLLLVAFVVYHLFIFADELKDEPASKEKQVDINDIWDY